MTLSSTFRRFRMKRRHVLMLALALDVLWLGARGARHYSPPPVATVDQPDRPGHVIT